MEHGFIDRYSGIASRVHRLDARTKILAALIYVIVAVTTTPQFLLAFVIYAGLLLWTVALARVPLTHVLSRAALVLPFSGLVALGLPFMADEKTVVFFGLSLSVKGLWLFAGAVMKSFLSVAALVLLVSTTPFSSLLAGLRQMKISAFFLDILALAYRYIFVLTDEAMRLRRAAAARGYRPSWLGHVRDLGQIIGRLFVRSYEQSERVYGAMRLRGYNGALPVATPSAFRLREGVGLLVMVAVMVGVRIWAR